MWAILKSPLTIGGAFNEGVIAFNQDSLGLSASLRRRWTEQQYETWSGDLEDGRVVAALINWDDVERDLTIYLPDVGVQYAGSIKDVCADQTVEVVRTIYTYTIAAHGVMLLELGNVTQAGVCSAELFATKSGYVPLYFYCLRLIHPWPCYPSRCFPMGCHNLVFPSMVRR